MNISPDSISGECNLKCDYSFNYPISNCSATNKNTFISLTYDATSVPAVKFNNSSYNVSQILLVAPSIHKFNGSNVGAELIITHTPIAGGNSLNVCIPIIDGGSLTKATGIMESIISTISTQAPASGDSTNIVLNDFTLNSIVPDTAFYSYVDSKKDNFIVYGINDAINISASSFKTLQSIVNISKDIVFQSGSALFINSAGPSQQTGDGQIYIDCQPTGNSEEITEITNVKPGVNMDFTFESIMKNPIVVFIISSILTIIIIYALYYLITYLSTGEYSVKIPKFSKNKSP